MDKRKTIKGSPVFEVTMQDLAASAEYVYGFESDDNIQKFLPLNFVRILNKTGCNLKIYLSQGTYGEVILDDTVYSNYGNFYSFKLENLDDTDTAEGANMFCTVQRKPAGVSNG